MPDDIRVSALDALAEYHPALNINRLLKVLFVILSLLGIGTSVLLVTFTETWSMEGLVFQHPTGRDFETTTYDCFWISIAQVFVLSFVSFMGAGSQRRPSTNFLAKIYKALRGKSNKSGKLDLSLNVEENFIIDVTEPLLDGSNLQVASNEEYEGKGGAERKQLQQVAEEYKNSLNKRSFRKNGWLSLLFLCSTAIQVYIGLKCISFKFTNEKIQGVFMGLGVVWVNLITWTLREMVHKSTDEDGELFPSLHPHKLHLVVNLGNHTCDLCGQRCKDGRAFRCKLCDFDLCMICYSKKDSHTLEGQLRGDQGVRKDENLSNHQYFVRSLKLIKEEWKIFTFGIMALLAYNMASLLTPKVQGAILNAVVDANYESFGKSVKFYLLISIFAGLFGGMQSLSFNVVGRKLTNTIRKKLFKGIIIQDIAFFDGNTSGQLTSRLTNDIGFMVTPIQSMLGTLISNSMLLFGGIVLSFTTSWTLSMLAFTTIGPIIHVAQLYAAWSRQLNRRIFGALAAANGIATEALGNIRTVKSFSAEQDEQHQYNQAINDALVKGVRDAFGGAGMYAFNSYLELGSGVLILWYGGIMAMKGKGGMTPGTLITFQLYWNMLNNAYKNLLDIVTSFTRAAGAAQRVFALIDSLPDIDTDAGKPIHASHLKGDIEFKNVTFAYQMRPDCKVLNDIDLFIPAGTTCALVGKSGGGKSTMVNLIMRFYDSQIGSIEIDGCDLKQLCLRDLRKQIGLVQQNTELFGGTIEENITYGMKPGSWSREDVIQAAKNACAHEFIVQFPEGYLTRVGERGIRISGGQKQRISIARVFLRNPKILLLDEATSALDAESEARVQEALDKLISDKRDKRTIILVAHRLSTVINADQIAVISGGKIVERGTHEELYSAQGVYAKLVQRQLSKKNSVLDVDSQNLNVVPFPGNKT